MAKTKQYLRFDGSKAIGKSTYGKGEGWIDLESASPWSPAISGSHGHSQEGGFAVVVEHQVVPFFVNAMTLGTRFLNSEFVTEKEDRSSVRMLMTYVEVLSEREGGVVPAETGDKTTYLVRFRCLTPRYIWDKAPSRR